MVKHQCTFFHARNDNSLGNRFEEEEVSVGRSVHTLTKLSHKKILFGGVSVLMRHVVSLMSLFLQVRNNGSFYISNIQTMTWTKLSSVPDIQPRAYHTATTCVLSGTLTVFLIGGGVTYSGNFPTDTIAVNECVILKVLDITSLDKIIFKMEKNIFSFLPQQRRH